MSKSKFSTIFREYISMTLGALCGALGMHLFIVPNNLVPGGMAGVSAILQYAVGLPVQYGLIIFNAPLLVLALIFLPKDFSVKTVYATLLSSLFITLFEIIGLPTFEAQLIVAVFLGGILGGLSMILAYNAKGSNGGTEIVGQLVQRKNPELDVGNLLFVLNLFIMSAGGFFTQIKGYNLWIVVYSLLYSYICSFVFNKYSRVVDPVVKFTIITYKAEEIATELCDTFKRGVTCAPTLNNNPATNNYSVLTVVVQVRQAYIVKKILRKFDGKYFAYTTAVENVVFRPEFSKRYK